MKENSNAHQENRNDTGASGSVYEHKMLGRVPGVTGDEAQDSEAYADREQMPVVVFSHLNKKFSSEKERKRESSDLASQEHLHQAWLTYMREIYKNEGGKPRTSSVFERERDSSLGWPSWSPNLNIWKEDYRLFVDLSSRALGLRTIEYLEGEAGVEFISRRCQGAMIDIFRLFCWDESKLLIDAQNKFLRKPGQKRWHLLDDTTLDEKRSGILGDLGLLEEILPKQKFYNHMVILGATYPPMCKRCCFVNDLMNIYNPNKISVGTITFISGQRPLSEGSDCEKILFPNSNTKTESDAARLAWDQHIFDEGLKSKIQFISVPMVPVPQTDFYRCPGLRDTFGKFIDVKKPSGTCLVISSNPWIFYNHQEILMTLESKNCRLKVETVGCAAPQSIKCANHLDNVTRMMQIQSIQELEHQPSAHNPIDTQTTKLGVLVQRRFKVGDKLERKIKSTTTEVFDGKYQRKTRCKEVEDITEIQMIEKGLTCPFCLTEIGNVRIKKHLQRCKFNRKQVFAMIANSCPAESVDKSTPPMKTDAIDASGSGTAKTNTKDIQKGT